MIKKEGKKGRIFLWRMPKLKPAAQLILWAVGLFVLFAFAHDRQQQRNVREVFITIQNQAENHFLDTKDVERLATLNHTDLLNTLTLERINLRAVEKRLYATEYIQYAYVYHDLAGKLYIKTKLHKPIARVVLPDGSGYYISETGSVFPLSSKFTARTMLFTGRYFQQHAKSDWNTDTIYKPYFQLIKALHQDNLMRRLFVTADVNFQGKITLYPQIGKQRFHFGLPSDLEDKLVKIKLFYKKIIPAKGWNTYEEVNLSFENQIVCTRN